MSLYNDVFRKMNQPLHDKIPSRLQSISPEERQAILDKVKNEYNLDINHGVIDDFQRSRFFDSGVLPIETALGTTGMDIKDFFEKNPYFNHGNKGKNIISSDHKDILLHEIGHANDKNMYPVGVAGSITKSLSPAITLATAGTMAHNAMKYNATNPEEEQKSALKAGLIGTGIGTGIGMSGGMLLGSTEDKANRFVQDYMTKEFGDKKLAKEWINNSSIPHARKTYRNGTLLMPLKTIGPGAIGGLVGAGIGAAHGAKELEKNNGQDKEANVKGVDNVSLIKVANEFEEEIPTDSTNLALLGGTLGAASGAANGALIGGLLKMPKPITAGVGAVQGGLKGAAQGKLYDWFREHTDDEESSIVYPLIGAGIGTGLKLLNIPKRNKMMLQKRPELEGLPINASNILGTLNAAGAGAVSGAGLDWFLHRHPEEIEKDAHIKGGNTVSLAKVANEFEQQEKKPISATLIGAGLGAGAGAFINEAKDAVDYVSGDYLKNREHKLPPVLRGGLRSAVGLTALGGAAGAAIDIARHHKKPEVSKTASTNKGGNTMSLVKLANEFEEQEQSKWRNTGIGAGIGAGLGAGVGALSGLSAARSVEGVNNGFEDFSYKASKDYNDFQRLHGAPGADKLIDPTPLPKTKVPRLPHALGGAAVGALGTGLLGAGIGGVTDVVRNINQQDKTASSIYDAFFKEATINEAYGFGKVAEEVDYDETTPPEELAQAEAILSGGGAGLGAGAKVGGSFGAMGASLKSLRSNDGLRTSLKNLGLGAAKGTLAGGALGFIGGTEAIGNHLKNTGEFKEWTV